MAKDCSEAPLIQKSTAELTFAFKIFFIFRTFEKSDISTLTRHICCIFALAKN